MQHTLFPNEMKKNGSVQIIIPDSISHIYLAFYFHGEYFDIYGDDVSIDDTKKFVKKAQNGWDDTTFGHYTISSMSNCIYKWNAMGSIYYSYWTDSALNCSWT